ncbi:MAG: S41 family peptidase [Bacteroidota bacterium]
MKRFLILFLTASTLLFCSAKSKSNENSNDGDTGANTTKTYSLEDYQEDFNQMVKLLLKEHPQPYAFIDKDTFDKLVNKQYNKITETTSLAKFIWICQELVAAIKCGHCEVWSKELYNVPNSMVFPMNVIYVGKQLYIIDPKNNSDKLAPGDEILSINGVNVKTLRDEMFKHISVDGFNESAKQERANALFRPYSSMFFDSPSSYKISVLKNGKVEEIILRETKKLARSKTFLDNCDNQLCFDTNSEHNTAIITIRSFAYYKDRFPIFKSFIDSSFQYINDNQIQDLIIDLRNNVGGDPYCGSYLLQHIATKPYIYFNKQTKGYKELKKPIQPSPSKYKNKPYILINGLCFSTTGHFCAIVKENNFGIFIGDTTAGTYTCNDNSKIFTLENTKVSCKVARNTFSTTVSTLTNKHGIIPDHYVIPTIDDFLNNTDPVLKFTWELIEKE